MCRMTVPGPNQTVHMMSWRGVLCVYWDMHRKEGMNACEMDLYTTDDLRRLYQTEGDDLIRLRDGVVSRVQLVAVIRLALFVMKLGATLRRLLRDQQCRLALSDFGHGCNLTI